MSEELTAKYFKKREALNVRCNQKSTTIRKKKMSLGFDKSKMAFLEIVSQ